MSLRAIHLVFIVASMLLAAFTTFWGVAMFLTERGAPGHLAFAAGSFCTLVGMAIYAVKFVRKTREIGMR